MAEFDAVKFIAGIHDYIGKALAPLASRLSAVEVQNKAVPTADEIALHFERRFSETLISFEQRFADTCQKAAAAIPKPKDGRDALELEDFDITLGDDGRTVTISLKRGETLIEKSIVIPSIQYQGVFEPEGKYLKGDALTYAGSLWLALVDAPKGVPGGSNDFQLACKKGRDGKDLRPNASLHDASKGVRL